MLSICPWKQICWNFSPRQHIATDLFSSAAKVVYKLVYAGSPLLCYVLVFITFISPFIESALVIYYPNHLVLVSHQHFTCSRTWISIFFIVLLQTIKQKTQTHKNPLRNINNKSPKGWFAEHSSRTILDLI